MGCRRCEEYGVCSDAAKCKLPFVEEGIAFLDKLRSRDKSRLLLTLIYLVPKMRSPASPRPGTM